MLEWVKTEKASTQNTHYHHMILQSIPKKLFIAYCQLVCGGYTSTLSGVNPLMCCFTAGFYIAISSDDWNPAQWHAKGSATAQGILPKGTLIGGKRAQRNVDKSNFGLCGFFSFFLIFSKTRLWYSREEAFFVHK